MEMNYTERYQELTHLLAGGEERQLLPSGVRVRYFPFTSTPVVCESAGHEDLLDDRVPENARFSYPVFYTDRGNSRQDVILMLHGLNERNWHKYFTWAEYLCQSTGKAVVLFPIAYHVNRSPHAWTNPRILADLLEQRKQRNGVDRSLSFANVALSERLSEKPIRFFTSGRQSYSDIVQLITEISDGRHPLFADNPRVDVFAYSIGAFLAQIMFLTEPLFAASRLFIFCGGGIFSAMYGCSRTIMDATSYKRLYAYFLNEFSIEEAGKLVGKRLAESFYSMIAPPYLRDMRLQLFSQMKSRMQGISLKNDKVIPYLGVKQALGDNLAEETFTVLDFPYAYSHENPFPVSGNNNHEVDEAFLKIFNMASGFLAT
jgi:pimeloyl-ACP methyl ester carboxylesterase